MLLSSQNIGEVLFWCFLLLDALWVVPFGANISYITFNIWQKNVEDEEFCARDCVFWIKVLDLGFGCCSIQKW